MASMFRAFSHWSKKESLHGIACGIGCVVTTVGTLKLIMDDADRTNKIIAARKLEYDGKIKKTTPNPTVFGARI